MGVFKSVKEEVKEDLRSTKIHENERKFGFSQMTRQKPSNIRWVGHATRFSDTCWTTAVTH